MQLTQTINGNEYRFRKNSSYFEQSAKLLVEEGVRLIGGCCGTTPEHIRAIKKGIKGLKPVKRKRTRTKCSRHKSWSSRRNSSTTPIKRYGRYYCY